MNKHLKAEIYRTLHTGNYFIYYLICVAAIFAVLFGTNVNTENYDFRILVTNMSQFSSMIVGTGLGTMLAIIQSELYSSRMYFYEIMDGAKTHHIICSKLMTQFLLSLIYVVPTTVGMFLVLKKYGAQEMAHPWVAVLLYALITVHVCLRIALLTMMVGKRLIAVIIPYALTMLEVVPMILQELLQPTSFPLPQSILHWFPTLQMMQLFEMCNNTGYIVRVVLSFVLNIALLYGIVYRKYRKKRF